MPTPRTAEGTREDRGAAHGAVPSGAAAPSPTPAPGPGINGAGHPAAEAAPAAAALTPEGAERLAAEVAAYADLPEGWDTHGGNTPGFRARVNAVAFLRELAEMGGVLPPHVAPRGDGGVGISWDSADDSRHLGLTFMPDDTFGWYGEAPGLEEEHDCDSSFVPGGGVPDRLLPWLARVAAALGARRGGGEAPPRGGDGGLRARGAGPGEPGRRRRGRPAQGP